MVSFYESIDGLRDFLRAHLARTLQTLNSKSEDLQSIETRAPVESEKDKQRAALKSFSSEFKLFLRRANAEWSSERDSNPTSTDDAKFILGRIASELVEHRSRITGDSGQITGILAEATTRLKTLQRHQVFLDGGRSFNAFWQEGDEVLLLLEIVPALLEDALSDSEVVDERSSLIRAAINEIEFNQENLKVPEYSTPAVLQFASVEKLLAAKLQLPERILSELQTYVQHLRAARDIHKISAGGVGDFMPETIKIENHLKFAKAAGGSALGSLKLFWRYRYQESSEAVH